MLVTFIKGAILGFSLSVLFIGPALFALIQTSIKTGFRSAAAMALGINISDAFLVLFVYFGASQFLDNPKFKVYEGIVGSAVLFIFGLYELFQKHEDEKDKIKGMQMAANVNKRLPWMVVKGFFLNILNPFVLLIWIGVVANVHHYSKKSDILIFFAGMLGMILCLDVLKSLAANRLKKILTHTIMLIIHYIMAIALMVSGAILLYDVLTGKGVSA